MSFLETPRFPVDIRYGSMGGPQWSTDITAGDNAVEYRNANWSLPLYRFNAKYDVKLRSVAIEVYQFFLACQGRLSGFRVKDWYDYTSAENGVTTPSRTDQTIGTGNGSTTTYQIVKTYTQGVNSVVRNITKPVSGSLLVEKNGVLQTLTTHYTIDYTTGIITFVTAPTSGHVIKCGYEFDVPCRFENDNLDDLSFTLMASAAGSNNDIVNYPDIGLIEIRV